MPKVYKVKEQAVDGSYILYHSSADIVAFDKTGSQNLDTNNVQDAIKLVNNKAESKVSQTEFNASNTEINEKIENVKGTAEACANTLTLTATINASGFRGSSVPYIATVPVEGILETDNPMIGAIYDGDVSTNLNRQEAWSQVQRITCTNGSIKVYCFEEKPTVDIPIQLKIVR